MKIQKIAVLSGLSLILLTAAAYVPAQSRGNGTGASNGSGIGAPSGSGLGSGNGSALGRDARTVVSSDVLIRLYKNRRTKGNATEINGAAAADASVGLNAGGGLGSASGNGLANDITKGVNTGAPSPVIQRTYISELDGGCYFVTSLGSKSYVSRGYCAVN